MDPDPGGSPNRRYGQMALLPACSKGEQGCQLYLYAGRGKAANLLPCPRMVPLESKNDEAAILLPQAPKRRWPCWQRWLPPLGKRCADLCRCRRPLAQAVKEAWAKVGLRAS